MQARALGCRAPPAASKMQLARTAARLARHPAALGIGRRRPAAPAVVGSGDGGGGGTGGERPSYEMRHDMYEMLRVDAQGSSGVRGSTHSVPAPRRGGGLTAVLLGAGTAGLLAAHVACQHADAVTLVESDRLESSDSDLLQAARQRHGIPQYAQPHGLAMGGLEAMEALLPGFTAELVRRGGLELDFGRDFRLFDFGAPDARGETSLKVVGKLTVVEGSRSSGLLWDDDGGAVLGVQLGGGERVEADLVVVASGRHSRLPQWLTEHGYAAPPVQRVDAGLTYASRIMEMPADWDGRWLGIVMFGRPKGLRGAFMLPMEGRRWQVVLKYAGSDNVRRAFDKAPLPRGLLVIGDAFLSLNPVYAQGMSVAAKSAQALDQALAAALAGVAGSEARRAAAQRVGPFFHKKVAAVQSPAWDVATSEDLRYPGTKAEGVAGPPRLLSAYFDALFKACHRDTKVLDIFLSIAHLRRPPYHIFHPRLLAAGMGTLFNPESRAQAVQAAKFVSSLTVAQREDVFSSWKRQHGRQYAAGSPEHAQRFAAFQANLAEVARWNQRNDVSFWKGLNNYSDMTWAKFSSTVLMRSFPRGPPPGRAAARHRPGRRLAQAGVPVAFDWRARGKVPAVRYQGNCGSCWAFAAVSALEIKAAIDNTSLPTLDFSEQQVLDCAAPHGCLGGRPEDAFEYISEFFVSPEAALPYTATDNQACPVWARGVGAVPKGSLTVKPSPGYTRLEPTADAVIDGLVARGPVVVAFAVDEDFMLYAGGIYPGTSCGNNLNHAMVIVGYSAAAGLPSGQSYYTFRNSWGQLWGESGYARVRMAADGAGTEFFVSPEAALPYTATDNQACPVWARGVGAVPKGSLTVKPSPGYTRLEPTADAVIDGLVARGPVVVAFAVDEDFMLYAGGIYPGTSCGNNLNHAMVIVGYSAAAGLPSGQSYYTFRNSWGQWWGEGGYARVRIAPDGAGTCGMYSDLLLQPVLTAAV
ncbi:cathepsin L1D [Micractinium conductrix]|uniref:Cathepsin L1D n=1 Tax=Micractinium conductrix TaxID=554055 RepID=A0A2P6VJ46_9CHLO|nr:cathepsin L1D [Micractinium conductrix]|eukprot:PSC74126.1 cathepsin L1D [Micractinium conductrix]